MKKLILFLIFLPFLGYSQVFNYKTEAIAVKPDTVWLEWEKVDFNIKADFTNYYIDIADQKFIIVKEKEPFFHENDNFKGMVLFCLDKNQIRCVLEFVIYKKQQATQLYLRYSDIEIAYQITKL